MSYYGVNRYVCACLEEMRTCIKRWTTEPSVHRVSHRHMKALIEEAQTLVNRMEAGLEDIHDFDKMLKEKRKLKKEIKELRAGKESLGDAEEDTASDWIRRIQDDD
jgi:cell shape-determining protein MreC